MLEKFVVDLLHVLISYASRALWWPRWIKLLLVLALDGALVMLATVLAFSIRVGSWDVQDWPILRFSLSMLAVWYPVAAWRGIYSAIFRFAGRNLIISITVSVLLMSIPIIVVYMYIGYPGVPRTVALLGPLFCIVLLCASRVFGRYVLVDLFHAQQSGSAIKNVLIYGAGITGQRLAATMGTEVGLLVVGFLDDDPRKWGKRIDGRTIHKSTEIAKLRSSRGVTDVVLAMPRISHSRRQQVIRELEQQHVKVSSLPPILDVLEGKISLSALRPIEIEDLLGREPIEPVAELLSLAATSKRVMVTGAGGSIGSELCRQILRQRPESLTLVESSEFALFQISNEMEALCNEMPVVERPVLRRRLTNVADRAAVMRLFAAESPHTIYHAAAYKHVPLLEENPLDGVANNLFATLNLAEMTVISKVERFILISTDKAVRPPNIMGASKRVCEMVLQDLSRSASNDSTIFSMVRFGNVLGSSGSVVPTFRRQIESGGPVTVTHRDVTRYFMTIPEAAALVMQAGGMARGGEVFLLEMGEPIRIWDLARSMIHLSGLTVSSESEPTGDIAIVEQGLRPGEKLYEELLVGENSQPTSHPRIMQAHEECVSSEFLQSQIAAIRAAIENDDVAGCSSQLKRLVPTLGEPARVL